MSIFQPAAPPKSALKLLSKTSALRVSPLCLGGAGFGERNESIMGKCTKEDCYALMDYYYEQGGNFIDTANFYQMGQSEEWIGAWMEDRKTRDQMVISTKYTSPCNGSAQIRANHVGNNRKSLHISFEQSLKRLKTDYIDILFLHWWDYTASIPEVMLALDALVRAGKVLYLGVSDTPAWVVVKANAFAREKGLSQFVIYQGRWSISDRDMERDIIPMCRDEGLALHIFGALGSGRYKTKEQLAAMASSGEQGRAITPGTVFGQKETDLKAIEVLEVVAKETGKSLTSIAMAFLLHKEPYVFPIVGGRKIEHLRESILILPLPFSLTLQLNFVDPNPYIEALSISLTPDQMQRLDAAVPLHKGFPFEMFGNHPAESKLLNTCGVYQWPEYEHPLPPINMSNYAPAADPAKK